MHFNKFIFLCIVNVAFCAINVCGEVIRIRKPPGQPIVLRFKLGQNVGLIPNKKITTKKWLKGSNSPRLSIKTLQKLHKLNKIQEKLRSPVSNNKNSHRTIARDEYYSFEKYLTNRKLEIDTSDSIMDPQPIKELHSYDNYFYSPEKTKLNSPISKRRTSLVHDSKLFKKKFIPLNTNLNLSSEFYNVLSSNKSGYIPYKLIKPNNSYELNEEKFFKNLNVPQIEYYQQNPLRWIPSSGSKEWLTTNHNSFSDQISNEECDSCSENNNDDSQAEYFYK